MYILVCLPGVATPESSILYQDRIVAAKDIHRAAERPTDTWYGDLPRIAEHRLRVFHRLLGSSRTSWVLAYAELIFSVQLL